MKKRRNKKQKEYLVVFTYESFDGSSGFGNNTIRLGKRSRITRGLIKQVENMIKGDNNQIKKAVLLNIVEIKVEK